VADVGTRDREVHRVEFGAGFPEVIDAFLEGRRLGIGDAGDEGRIDGDRALTAARIGAALAETLDQVFARQAAEREDEEGIGSQALSHEIGEAAGVLAPSAAGSGRRLRRDDPWRGLACRRRRGQSGRLGSARLGVAQRGDADGGTHGPPHGPGSAGDRRWGNIATVALGDEVAGLTGEEAEAERGEDIFDVGWKFAGEQFRGVHSLVHHRGDNPLALLVRERGHGDGGLVRGDDGALDAAADPAGFERERAGLAELGVFEAGDHGVAGRDLLDESEPALRGPGFRVCAGLAENPDAAADLARLDRLGLVGGVV
jgi:hypothetical protein